MNTEWLYNIDLYKLFGMFFLLSVVTVAIGYWRGRTANNRPAVESLLELIPASLLGLLALLLGFTFSMSISRFDTRKQVMVREANAIETTWLRAGLLPEAPMLAAREALLGYLQHRIAFPSRAVAPEQLKEYDQAQEKFVAFLWRIAQAEGQRDRSAITGLFVNSLNEMIDLGTERQFAANDHVPEIAHFVILTLIIASLYTLSYVYGHNRYRVTAPIMMSILLTLLSMMIMDLDRPTRGIIRVQPTLMQNLYETLTQRQNG